MYSLSVENERKEMIELTNSPFFDLLEIDGLLPSAYPIKSSKVANADGSQFNSNYGEDRPITITIKPKYPIEANRNKLYRYLNTGEKVKLYYKNNSRDVMIEGYVDNYDGSLFEMKQTLIIYIKCLDPDFKDRFETQANMSTVMDLFEFPFSIEEEGIPFSEIDKALTQNVINNGNKKAGLIIELTATGEVVNPRIYNVDTRESLGLKMTMKNGDKIRINTNKFKVGIELTRNGVTQNAINSIMKNPTWFQLDVGDNLFTYVCESGEEFLNIKFIYSNLYKGV